MCDVCVFLFVIAIQTPIPSCYITYMSTIELGNVKWNKTEYIHWLDTYSPRRADLGKIWCRPHIGWHVRFRLLGCFARLKLNLLNFWCFARLDELNFSASNTSSVSQSNIAKKYGIDFPACAGVVTSGVSKMSLITVWLCLSRL